MNLLRIWPHLKQQSFVKTTSSSHVYFNVCREIGLLLTFFYLFGQVVRQCC
jgi:hypothetical protein